MSEIVERVAKAICGAEYADPRRPRPDVEPPWGGYVAAARAAIAAMSEWQDISTAPKDGRPVLLALAEPMDTSWLYGWMPFGSIQVLMGWWESDGWVLPFMDEGAADSEGYSSTFFLGQIHGLPSQPTHWMPLPPAPTNQEEKGK